MTNRDKGYILAELFKALGDFSRLRIIRILASNMESEICVSDIAKILGITTPAVSQHIKVLKSIGILVPEKKGFRVFYKIDREKLIEYKKLVDEMFELASMRCENYPNC